MVGAGNAGTIRPVEPGPRPSIAQDLCLDIGYLRLRARRWGDPRAATRILALHGWLDNANSFLPLAQHLMHDTCLVALEFAGHGHSEHRPAGLWYHFVDYVFDVVRAARALSWDRFHLLGHSLGGAVATFLAAGAPQCLQSLMLIEALGPLGGTPEQAPQRLRQAIAALQDPDRRTRIFVDIGSAVTARAAAGPTNIDCARLLVERGLRPVADGFTWRSDPRLTLPSPYRLGEAHIQAMLRALDMPLLVLMSRDDARFRRMEHAETRAAAVPQARVELLPGGHHLHMESPGDTARAILGFLKDLSHG